MAHKIIIMLAIIALPVLAFAEEGKQANFTINIELGDSLFSQLETGFGEGEGEADAALPEGQVQTGMLYWSNDAMRMELDIPETVADPGEEASSDAEFLTIVTIVDYAAQIIYLLDEESKTATATDLSAAEEMASQMGFPMADPGTTFMDWSTFYESLKDTPSIELNELPIMDVNGYACAGYTYTMNMGEMMSGWTEEGEDDDTDMDDTDMMMGLMSMFGDMSGEFWIQEGIEFPIRMQMSLMGMSFTQDLTDIQDWDIDPTMLTVPEDYEIDNMEMPDFEDVEEIGQAA